MSEEPAVSVLLLLRLKAFAPDSVIASGLDAPTEDVASSMESLAARGWVQHRERGLATGWSLTPSGRRAGEQMLRDELARAGTAAEVEACYRAFLPLNSELLSVCTDWQTVVVDGEHVPNDHTDPVRDATVLGRLDALHRGALPVIVALADALGRFAAYPVRLERAHQHVRSGRIEWIAKPTVDSYHGTWFELHEHLLVTLGRDRATEALPSYAPTPNGDSS